MSLHWTPVGMCLYLATCLAILGVLGQRVDGQQTLFLNAGCVRDWTCKNLQQDTTCKASPSKTTRSEGCFAAANFTDDSSTLLDFTATRFYKKLDRHYDRCGAGLNLTWNTQLKGANQIVMLEIISLHEGFPDDVECVSFDITTRSADVITLHFDCLSLIIGGMELQLTTLVKRSDQSVLTSDPLHISTGHIDTVPWVYETDKCVPEGVGPHIGTRGRRVTTTEDELTTLMLTTGYSDQNDLEVTQGTQAMPEKMGVTEKLGWPQSTVIAAAVTILGVCFVISMLTILLYRRCHSKKFTKSSLGHQSVSANSYTSQGPRLPQLTGFHPNGGFIGDIRMIPDTAMSDTDSFYIAPDDDVFTSGFSIMDSGLPHNIQPPMDEHRSVNTQAFQNVFPDDLPPHMIVHNMNRASGITSSIRLPPESYQTDDGYLTSQNCRRADYLEIIGDENDYFKLEYTPPEGERYERLDKECDTYMVAPGPGEHHPAPPQLPTSDSYLDLTDPIIRDSGYDDGNKVTNGGAHPLTMMGIVHHENHSPVGSIISMSL